MGSNGGQLVGKASAKLLICTRGVLEQLAEGRMGRAGGPKTTRQTNQNRSVAFMVRWSSERVFFCPRVCAAPCVWERPASRWRVSVVTPGVEALLVFFFALFFSPVSFTSNAILLHINYAATFNTLLLFNRAKAPLRVHKHTHTHTGS